MKCVLFLNLSNDVLVCASDIEDTKRKTSSAVTCFMDTSNRLIQ